MENMFVRSLFRDGVLHFSECFFSGKKKTEHPVVLSEHSQLLHPLEQTLSRPLCKLLNGFKAVCHGVRHECISTMSWEASHRVCQHFNQCRHLWNSNSENDEHVNSRWTVTFPWKLKGGVERLMTGLRWGGEKERFDDVVKCRNTLFLTFSNRRKETTINPWITHSSAIVRKKMNIWKIENHLWAKV